MRIEFAIVAALTANTPGEERLVGMWANGENWQTELIEVGDISFCRTSTQERSAFGIKYSLELSFGDRNEAALITDRQLPLHAEAALNFEDGSGYDFYDLQVTEAKSSKYRLSNSLSSSMMAKLITSLRGYQVARFEVGDMSFPLDLTQFEQAYSDMRKCERYKAGFVLPD